MLSFFFHGKNLKQLHHSAIMNIGIHILVYLQNRLNPTLIIRQTISFLKVRMLWVTMKFHIYFDRLSYISLLQIFSKCKNTFCFRLIQADQCPLQNIIKKISNQIKASNLIPLYMHGIMRHVPRGQINNNN